MITDNNCYIDKSKKLRVIKCETYYWAPADWNVHLLIKATVVWWCDVWTKYTTLLLFFKNAVPRVIRYNGIYQEGDLVIKKPEGQSF